MTLKLKNNTLEPGRNELCVCGSGLKFKFCHGDPGKRAVCSRVAQEKMLHLIMDEKHRRGLLSIDEYNAFLNHCNPEIPPEPVSGRDVDKLIDSTGLIRCADCGSVVPSGDKLCMKCKRKRG